MKLLDLYLKNIGPFLDDTVEFATFENSKKQVTILTGENGTGKTIILDTIRGLLLGDKARNSLKRKISRNDDFSTQLSLSVKNQTTKIYAKKFNAHFPVSLETESSNLNVASIFYFPTKSKGNIWIANYWTSQNDNESFNIASLDFLKPDQYLINALDGIQKNAETTKIITFFDYYKSSDKLEQKKEGEFIYETIKRIFKISLNEGELKYVDRASLLPIIEINGNEISLEKLSSGNLYLIQRMLGLLSQMYSVYKLNDLALEDMLKTPGVLLIDEAENHLHPKWQKTFLNSILEIFPNLQIIATTHSPFIVGSVDGAKIYVCKSQDNHSVIEDETSFYSNKPINEILVSEVFSETQPFASKEISDLLEEREKAIHENNKELENKIEDRLLEINPQYFSYFKIDDLIKQIQNQ
ncbi:AAA family ATPase [Chryseobacterium sp. Ch-15]|uniref:AAA family ATPase n=1 Tax=Chryseobacterium muglaense TaxID=2893752 RepID=A0A9Q3UUY3_9FLAO|nr:AAA family ATPase [Chryseobacterium muglaense]MBD3905804.1 AAA family ATPase [Chryseobacterium muglaense]MCC9033839.1 AAA family ATPase [Chryseobacterium muglaense]MCM2554059.1 AAA family ATPase [Chryseobacterium muglaense]